MFQIKNFKFFKICNAQYINIYKTTKIINPILTRRTKIDVYSFAKSAKPQISLRKSAYSSSSDEQSIFPPFFSFLFFFPKDSRSLAGAEVPHSLFSDREKKPCPSMIKSSPEFYPRKGGRNPSGRLKPPLFYYLRPSPSRATFHSWRVERGFIFDRTFASLRSRLRKVERDNRYVFVYSRHLEQSRCYFFLSPSVLCTRSARFLLSSHLHRLSSDLLFAHRLRSILRIG